MMRAASGVAETAILPVEVLMKCAPDAMAIRLARKIIAGDPRAPVSRMTFSDLPCGTSPATPSIISRTVTSSSRSSAL